MSVFQSAMSSMRTFVLVGILLAVVAPKAAEAQGSTGRLQLTLEYVYKYSGNYVPDIPLTLTPTGTCSFQDVRLDPPSYPLGQVLYLASATVTGPFLFGYGGSVEVDCGLMLSDAHQSILINHFVYVPNENPIFHDPLGTIHADVSQNGTLVAQGIEIAATRIDDYRNYYQPDLISVVPSPAFIMLSQNLYGLELSYSLYLTLASAS